MDNRHLKLTNSQLMMWTGQKLNPEIPLYNEALLWEINAPLDAQKFQESFQELINKTESLRLTFHEGPEGPHQEILPVLNYHLDYQDWSQDQRKPEELLDTLSEKTALPFDLTKCCFDAVLIKIDEENFAFYLNQHHLITDAHSQQLVFERLGNIYFGNHHSESFPDYTPFLEFEESEKQLRSTETKEYWNTKLDGWHRINTFYGENTKTTQTRSDRLTLQIEPDLASKIRDFVAISPFSSWGKDLSIYNFFCSVLMAFIHRVSGGEQIAVGTPIHNRPTAGLKATTGLFIEFFPACAKLDTDMRFRDLFMAVKGDTFEMLKNTFPGSSQAQWNQHFNVVLNYMTTQFGSFGQHPCKTTWVSSGHIDANHSMRLQINDFNKTGGFELYFDLNQGVFGGNDYQELPQHFTRLLKAFLKDPEQPIGRPALSQLTSFQESVQSPFKSVVELFEERITTSKDNIALVFEDSPMTYEEVGQKVNQVAAYLQQAGVKRGDHVGVYLDRSPELVISLLAVLKVNATYVPLSSDLPQQRLRHLIEDSQISALITRQQVDLDGRTEVISIDQAYDLDPDLSTLHSSPVQAEDVAYVMYTSGSTGQPKGVMISQGSLAYYLQWAQKAYSTSTDTVFPFFTSISFDLTITSIFLPLVSGGSMVIFKEPEDKGRDLSILNVIEDQRVNTVKLTPSHLAIALDHGLENSTWKKLIIGGEEFKVSLAQSLFQALNEKVRVFNEYGPTEATVGCIYHELSPADFDLPSVPIGVPIDGSDAIIMDDYGHVVPSSVPGEICLAGPGLAMGYWNNETLTKEKFVPHPTLKDELIYKTGDVGRKNKDGLLEYLGRSDDQVKIGGIRVELAEIEAAVDNYPGIGNAVVLLEKQTPRTPQKTDVKYCVKCGLPSNYPTAKFDEEGVCNLCNSYEHYQRKTASYFRSMADLKNLLNSKSKEGQGYDCLVLYSGGKDSTYALSQVVNMGFNVLAYTLDNGYISDQAKGNIKRVVNALGVDHIFGETPAMNAIFRDSLQKFANVCNGCFKTLYTLSTQVALDHDIPFVITGLSRGQFFETRLTEELFTSNRIDAADIDETILNLRKTYHRSEDAVSRLLDVSMFQSDDVFDKVQFVDFYRYCDSSLEEMLTYLDENLPWVRPTDTGRSTNCLINDLGIYYHKKKMGFHNYAFPYSWDVRTGHKKRQEALDELNDKIDEGEVHRIMDEIGFNDAIEGEQLYAYYESSQDLSENELKEYLRVRLPSYMIPTHFKQVETLPLSKSGKIDREALRNVSPSEQEDVFVAPETEFEELIAQIWSDILGKEKISTRAEFIALGGQSLSAIRIMSRLNETLYLDLPVSAIFEDQTIELLAKRVETIITNQLSQG